MVSTSLSITYLGAVLCYVASPASAVGRQLREAVASRWLRPSGCGLLVLSFGLGMVAFPVSTGILVWLSMSMTAFSVLVIAGPLVDRFVPITSALALVLALIGPWI